MKRDPIALLRTEMEKRGEWSDADMTKLDEELKATVEDAYNFADASPEPALDTLYEDVLAESAPVGEAAGAGATTTH